MSRAPFPPLLADADELAAFPKHPTALIARMAAIYGVDPSNVLPTQGPAQALALLARHVALTGKPSIASAPRTDLARIARVNRVTLTDEPEEAGALILASPDLEGAVLSLRDIIGWTKTRGDALLVLDESLIEFTEAPSAATLLDQAPNLVVLRDLSFAYGLAGAPCAALLAAAPTIALLREAEEPGALPAPIAKLAAAVLEPQRLAANTERIARVRATRARLAGALPDASEAGGPFVWLAPKDQDAARDIIRRFALEGQWRGNRFLLALSTPEADERALAAFGVQAARPPRTAAVVRDTAETRIVASINLDREGDCDVSTGIGFFDHMLSQIAMHGGFSLTLSCVGDLEVDGHHTIEDCALTLGQALKQALGAKRGIARFGFMLPMDEAEARVSVDLSGRPFLVFEGTFAATHIGAYPTEMTEHVFRSLAQSMGASIHLHVAGENDHHKTEACYKAFGRALRQAIRIEGEALPSTKGAL